MFMLSIQKNKFSEILNLEQYSQDGRLTEPSDGKIFDYRRMLDVVNRLGRPLTDQEAEEFRIK